MKKGLGVLPIGVGIVFGIVMGAATHQPGVWLPIGIALGAAGMLLTRRQDPAAKTK